MTDKTLQTSTDELDLLRKHLRLSHLLPHIKEEIAERKALDDEMGTCRRTSDRYFDLLKALNARRWKREDISDASSLRPLPSQLADLTLTQREGLAEAVTFDGIKLSYGENWSGVPGPAVRSERERAIDAGIIRGEIDFPERAHGVDCLGTHCGGALFVVVRNEELGLQAEINLSGHRHPLVRARAAHDPEYLTGRDRTLLSPRHIKHSLHSMVPWSPSPVPRDKQQAVIDRVRTLTPYLDGWSLLGPPGTSKTALVSAWIKDELTLRYASGDAKRTIHGYELCVWKTRFDDWIEEMYKWKYREHDDVTTPEPALTAQKVRDACRGGTLRPIVWIEEVDKLVPTPKQLNLFNSLIDSIYELEGMLIVTGNGTLASLSSKLDDSTVRRFSGDADDSAKFLRMDLSSLATTNSQGSKGR